MAIVVDQLVTEFIAKDGVSGPAKSMTGAIGSMASSIPAATAALIAFGGAVAVAAAGSLVSLGEKAVRASADIGQLKLALGTVSDQPDKQFERLVAVSNELGADIEALTMSFVGLRAAGAEMELTERAVRSFANAARTVPNSTAALQQAFLGLRQIQSSDIIQGEEIKQITEALPQAAKVLKEAFNTIKGEDMRAQGVTPQVFVETLIAGMEKLPVAAGGATLAWTRFDNAVKLSLATMGDSLNQTLTPMLNDLTDNLNRLGSEGGTLDRIGEKWAAIFSVEANNGVASMLALLMGTLEAMPAALQKIGGEILAVVDAIKSGNVMAFNQAMLNYLFWGDNATQFGQDAKSNADKILLEMGVRGGTGATMGAQLGAGSPVTESATTNPVVSQLAKIERNTRPLLDFQQYTLGGGEFGQMGVTATEIAGLKGMATRSKVETAVRNLVSALEEDATSRAMKAFGSMKKMGATY